MVTIDMNPNELAAERAAAETLTGPTRRDRHAGAVAGTGRKAYGLAAQAFAKEIEEHAAHDHDDWDFRPAGDVRAQDGVWAFRRALWAAWRVPRTGAEDRHRG